MSLLGSLETAWRLAHETPRALDAFREALVAQGPLAAVRAFAEATEGRLDDAVAAELETACRAGLQWLDRLGALLALAADPKVAIGLDQTLHALLDIAFRVGDWRAKVRLWLAAVPPRV